MPRIRLVGFLAAASLGAAVAALAADSNNPPSWGSSTAGPSVADSLVRSALLAETKSDLAGRRELLAKALEADEQSSAARWQLGQVRYQGRWMTIEDAAQAARGDRLLAEYRQMPERFDDGLEAQRKLARWCRKNQLADPARAHAARLLEMQPNDPLALLTLGLSRYQGLLLTTRQIAESKNHDKQAKQAVREWGPRLTEIQRQIRSDDDRTSVAGWRALRAIDDPAAIIALESVFSKHRRSESLEVVGVIGRMPGRASTESLVRHSLLSKWDEVRLAACERLSQRSPLEYVPKLIGSLSTPIEAQFVVVPSQRQISFFETVLRSNGENKEQRIIETRVPLNIPNPNLFDIVNQAAIDAFTHAQTTAKACQRMARRQQEMNDEVYWVLEKSTGQTLPHDPDAWHLWWRQQNFMTTYKNPTKTYAYVNYVDVPYVQPPPRHGACFALGTKVCTLTGPVEIEKVRLGDQVLAQDPFSGELTYKPVLQTTVGHGDLISIDLGSEQLAATPGHVFWVSGAGWQRANQLKLGDRLHSVDGWAEIVGLKDVDAADTRNLVVADYGTYFVGDKRLLVHDVTMLQPYAGKVPGDTPNEEFAAK